MFVLGASFALAALVAEMKAGGDMCFTRAASALAE